MLTIGLLQESGTTTNISWLVWVVLAIFVVMVFLGWWASSRLPKEDETVPLHESTHNGHEEAISREEETAPELTGTSVGPDDLVSLEGIGPKVAEVLAGLGITTFAALAAADPEEIKRALAAAGYGFMEPEGWVEQAKLAASGDHEGLRRLQTDLKGGRRAH